MNWVEFKMERFQSTWENRVKFNLSESSVHPMSAKELISDPDFLDQLLSTPLVYSQSNGTDDLRSEIAAHYRGATLDHVEVTNGGSEANFITLCSMLDPGDEILIILPNYQQIWGLAHSLGMRVKEVHLQEQCGWVPDPAELESVATADTKMIVVCNPNNPTGSILTETQMDEIVRTAARSGAWILADEIYQGSERNGRETPSFWGKYDRVIVTNGLSKAYGLPGLRIGWIVAPRELVAKMWSYHDYTTIAPGTLSDMLAQVAVSHNGRARCFERTRSICRHNFPLLQEWVTAHGSTLRMVEPHAGAIAYVRYDLPVNSTHLAERLLHEKSVLVVPGDHFGMDHFLRIGYGPPAEYVRHALEHVSAVLDTVACA